MNCVIGAEEAQVSQFYEEHSRKLSVVPRPFKLRTVLEAIYPNSMWQSNPCLEHAARWLIWLDEVDPPAVVLPFLRTQTMLWRATARDIDDVLYSVHDAYGARELLASWLGYSDTFSNNVLPLFPVEVPLKHQAAAKRRWSTLVVQTNGVLVRDLLKRPLPRRMRETAAIVAVDFYKANRGDLTHEMIRMLSDYLPSEITNELWSLSPPPAPNAVPSDVDVLKSWFKEEYLPYRRWCLYSDDTDALQKVEALAREFAAWYLKFYPTAVAGGNRHLAFVRSGKTRANAREGVTLLVVADGLCVTDAEFLMHEIASREQRLSVSVNDVLFSPIPTITVTSKIALIHGCTPRDAETLNTATMASGVTFVGENQDLAAAMLKATDGTFLVWSNLEPDRAYHNHAEKKAIEDQVLGALRTLADRIVKAAAAAPAHLRLRILLTTDHGRLLGRSIRSIAAPKGMAPHQRAALGIASTPFYENGCLIDASGAFALLDGRRYAISDTNDCAVMLSGDCFLTIDGKTGEELFPHGGMYPEEVLVPWCEVDRDAEPPNVLCKASGSARESRKGEVSLLFVNAGQVDVKILSAEFQFCDKPLVQLLLNEVLPRQHQVVVKEIIDPWPTPTDLRAAIGVARLRLPVGDEIDIAITLELCSEGFQERQDIMGDLL
jgi:hypothetical protein